MVLVSQCFFLRDRHNAPIGFIHAEYDIIVLGCRLNGCYRLRRFGNLIELNESSSDPNRLRDTHMSDHDMREIKRQFVINRLVGIGNHLSCGIGNRTLRSAFPHPRSGTIGIDGSCTHGGNLGRVRQEMGFLGIPHITAIRRNLREHSSESCLTTVFGSQPCLFLRLSRGAFGKRHIAALEQGVVNRIAGINGTDTCSEEREKGKG